LLELCRKKNPPWAPFVKGGTFFQRFLLIKKVTL